MSLYTCDGKEVPPFSRDVDLFLGRSVMLFGSSNSGKSTIIRDILAMVKDHIPNILVFCPTNKLNNSYTGIVPAPLIHEEVDEDIVKFILERQKQIVNIYNSANRVEMLKTIHDKLELDDSPIHALNTAYEKVLASSPGAADRLYAEHCKNIIQVYKKSILTARHKIKNSGLSEYEMIVAQHLNINPNFMMIIDDAARTAKIWCKFSAIKELFFNGRHYKTSFMIAFQDDILLDSQLRKNAFINIFTTEIVMNAYFNRSSNSFTTGDKKSAERSGKAVFTNSKDSKYRKVIYMKDADPKFYHYTARVQEDFMFGSPALQRFCDKVKKREDDIDMNMFSKLF